MKKYILMRCLSAIPLFFSISFVIFVFVNLIPSDPAEVVLRVNQVPIITESLLIETRERLGLNDSYFVRYFTWLKKIFSFDFGVSYTNPLKTVKEEILSALPNTLILASFSLLLVIVFSLPIGFFCAVYKNSTFDKMVRFIVFITTAMPSYWVGLLLILIFSVYLHLFPTGGNYDGFKSMILPSTTIALTYISTFIRLIRNNMIDNMKEDYVLYAQVRGLKMKHILVKHVLRNSLHSCIIAFGMSIPQLIAGTIVVENVFAWPGLGTLCVDSIFNRDYPVIQAYILLMGILFIFFNLCFDIIQALIDPKFRLGE